MVNLLIVSPHPDDETLYCGGLITRAVNAGIIVHSVYLTSGNHGRTLGIVEPEELGEQRINEAKSAANVLGISNTVFLNYNDFDPDNSILPDWQDLFEKLITSTASIINENTIIISMPPNGINGHPDHTESSKIALSLSKTFGNLPILYMSAPELLEYPERTGFLSLKDRHKLKKKSKYSATFSKQEARIKLEALSCYKTQALSVFGFIQRAQGDVFTEYYAFSDDITAPIENLVQFCWLKNL